MPESSEGSDKKKMVKVWYNPNRRQLNISSILLFIFIFYITHNQHKHVYDTYLCISTTSFAINNLQNPICLLQTLLKNIQLFNIHKSFNLDYKTLHFFKHYQ